MLDKQHFYIYVELTYNFFNNVRLGQRKYIIIFFPLYFITSQNKNSLKYLKIKSETQFLIQKSLTGVVAVSSLLTKQCCDAIILDVFNAINHLLSWSGKC